ncbi:50S ribosomal protein L17 [Candidatus Woesebacteria bacterium RIFCSPLOWO2_01_FULL_39_10]|uniref:50S ribosomal protein L17 n=1 Tax=Candidatus Woesebacteria bacterium RIFCSPLOWO2_01_FULL_39_10 TaxID=1802516 RepID=A0A1F8B3P3_9BACT|nr:MAG: 50S ribosomal protein L17 [Candidatus Woesebacteria bacterium RIFCSPLOWO2_01_FULL_39_10]
MKKKVFGRHLSRDRGSRDALFRSLIKALIERGTIQTTKPKAQAIQTDVDRLVTLVKKNSLSAKRAIYSFLANDRKSVDRLFTTVSDRFPERYSGFTRFINLPKRLGDNSQLVRLEWSQQAPEKPKIKDKDEDKGKKTKSNLKEKEKGKKVSKK